MRFLKQLAAAGVFAFSTATWANDTGITDTSITIGMSAPLSGPNGAYGIDMRQTISAYYDQV